MRSTLQVVIENCHLELIGHLALFVFAIKNGEEILIPLARNAPANRETLSILGRTYKDQWCANPSNEISPTNASHVAKKLAGKIPLVVDGGQSQVGIESTVVDLTANPPRILRPGMIHEESLLAALADCGLPAADCGLKTDPHAALRSPGLLKKHYSPKAKLVILNWTGDADLRQQLSTINHQPSTTHLITHTHIPSEAGFASVSVIPHDAEAFARALYSELHRCDEAGAEMIVVEALPEKLEWRAIADRLRRAAA